MLYFSTTPFLRKLKFCDIVYAVVTAAFQNWSPFIKTCLFNPLKTKRSLLYLKTQFVPRS